MIKRYIVIIGLALISGISLYARHYSIDSINSTVDTVMLQEVVVNSTRPITKISGDGFVTNIKGTILQNLGTAKDVLGFIPGVINNNGSIEIIGKGSPVIYINGRRILNNNELEILSSERIKEIKVINNPGARYGNEISAVIRIQTERMPGDGFAIEQKMTIGHRDYLYGKELVNFNYRTGRMDLFGNVESNLNKSKGSDFSIQKTCSSLQHIVDMNTVSKAKGQLYSGKMGLNYSSSNSNSFGLYYEYINKPTQTTAICSSSSFINGLLNEANQYGNSDKIQTQEHLIDGYYSGSHGKWSLDAAFNILFRYTNEKQTVLELTDNIGKRTLATRDLSNGRLYAGEFHVSHPMANGSINFGSELTNTWREDVFESIDAAFGNNDTKIIESNCSFYSEFMQQWGKVTVRFGLRFEHVKSQYFEHDIIIDEQSRIYNRLLPSALLMIPIKNVMLQLFYSQKYNRPLYSQLNNNTKYVNQYLYESGNPLLHPSLNENLSVNVKYRWLMASIEYRHVDGQIITSCNTYNEDSDVTLMKKVNSLYDLNRIQGTVTIQPWFKNKYYYPVLMGGVLAQIFKTDYMGGNKSFNDPILFLNFNNIIQLPHNYMINASLSWRSKGNSENIRAGQTFQLNIAVMKTISKHWDIKLSLNDIFNTAKENQFTIYSGIRNVFIARSNNLRGVECTVRYQFNIPKSKYKGKGAGNEEKKRL